MQRTWALLLSCPWWAALEASLLFAFRGLFTYEESVSLRLFFFIISLVTSAWYDWAFGIDHPQLTFFLIF